MKYAVIVLSTVALAACDGLSVAQKKPAAQAAKPAAFIAKGDALFVVHVGDVVESLYRVESFNSAQVVVTYLPLQQRQTIEVTGG